MIIIGTPSSDYVTAEYAASLYDLAIHSERAGLKTVLCNARNNDFMYNRNQIVRTAMQTRASHIMWIDADMAFPGTVLCDLYAREAPIVGCTYRKRRAPHDYVHLDTDPPDQANLAKVAYMACGMMLVSTAVYHAINKPYRIEETSKIASADYQFCKDARESGFDVLLDRELSKKIGHMATIRI